MGKAKLTKQEQKGYALFRGKGMCHRCHISNGQKALFTDFTYDNLGVPKNPDNPFYYAEPVFNPLGYDWVDEGLGGFLTNRIDYAVYADANLGKQKVPTLRNVDKRPGPDFVKAYGHNGYFKSLWGIVHFYNTRDVKPQCDNPFTTEADALSQDCWPAPEVAENVNMDELGNLGLTLEEEDAIVAFLTTLSDGYQP
jgi:cytochrome c peroxidase